MNRVLPVLTIALAIATFAVLGATRTRDMGVARDVSSRLNRLAEKGKAADSEAEALKMAMERLEERAKALGERVDDSRKPVPVPDDAEIASRAGAVAAGKWDEFHAKMLLAQGKIGVIQPGDAQALKKITEKAKPEIERLGVSGENADKAARAVAETAVLYGRARELLAANPGALAYERKRLIGEAERRLAAMLRDYQLKRVMETVLTLTDGK